MLSLASLCEKIKNRTGRTTAARRKQAWIFHFPEFSNEWTTSKKLIDLQMYTGFKTQRSKEELWVLCMLRWQCMLRCLIHIYLVSDLEDNGESQERAEERLCHCHSISSSETKGWSRCQISHMALSRTLISGFCILSHAAGIAGSTDS